jgi:hypothetical protein
LEFPWPNLRIRPVTPSRSRTIFGVHASEDFMPTSIVAALVLSAAAMAAAEPPAAETPTPEPAAIPVASAGDGAGDDPNYSRLLFAPTGRPLKKGDGYFSDYEVLFPGLAVGLTDHVSQAASR